jgi:hypothetical protein
METPPGKGGVSAFRAKNRAAAKKNSHTCVQTFVSGASW